MQEIQSSHASLNRTLPEMSEKIHEWRTKREHLNHVFSQMQTIFRSVFEVNQPNGAGYPTQIECLQENTILNNSQLQVDEFINQVNQNQETVEGIVREIETSREELHDWLVGQQAAALWRWPN